MIRIATLTLIVMLLFPCKAFCADGGGKGGDPMDGQTTAKIRMVLGDKEIVVAMSDNPAARDFLALLPLTTEFRDFAGAEKIADLPRRLQTNGSPTARNATGDFTYYAPWGNIAVFYKGSGSDGQLYVLGRIESGKDILASMNRNFTARIEIIP